MKIPSLQELIKTHEFKTCEFKICDSCSISFVSTSTKWSMDLVDDGIIND